MPSELLDEVVVIGYGAVKKSDLTSSISTVKGKEITETVTGNAMDALQGKINGVQVTSGGGPGRTTKSSNPWCNNSKRNRSFVCSRWHAGRYKHQLPKQ